MVLGVMPNPLSVWLFFFPAGNNVVFGCYGTWLCDDQRKSSVNLIVWGCRGGTESFAAQGWAVPSFTPNSCSVCCCIRRNVASSWLRWRRITSVSRQRPQLIAEFHKPAFVGAGRSSMVFVRRAESSSSVIAPRWALCCGAQLCKAGLLGCLPRVCWGTAVRTGSSCFR